MPQSLYSNSIDVTINELDWRVRFEELIGQQSTKLALYLRRNDAFEATLREWRRFHCTPVMVDGEQKRMPAAAVDGIIALAELGIMPPRSLDPDPNNPNESKLKQDNQFSDVC